MLAELFGAVVGLATKSVSASTTTHLIDLPDGRSMLAVIGQSPTHLFRPRREVFLLHSLESFADWLKDRDADCPIYADEKRAIAIDECVIPECADNGTPRQVIERVGELRWTMHADLVTICGLAGKAFRSRDLVTLGRTSLVDLFVDPAQKKSWRDTFQTIIATSGKESRSDTRIASSNYGSDVKSAIVSSGGTIDSWDEFDLSVRVFVELPAYRCRVRLALIADGESATFALQMVGSSLRDAQDAARDFAAAKLAELSHHPVIRGTSPDSLLPLIKV